MSGLGALYRRIIILENGDKEAKSGVKKRDSLHSLRFLDKIIKLKDDKSTYKEWRWRVCTNISPINSDLVAAMEWADKCKEEVGWDEIELKYEPTVLTDLKPLIRELYALLANATEGEATVNYVQTTTEENGLEAWRKLTRRYGEVLPAHSAIDVQKLMNPRRARMEDIEEEITRWLDLERQTKVQKQSNALPEDFRKEALLQMCPENLEKELRTVHDAATLTFVQIKSKIETAVAAWRSCQAHHIYRSGKKNTSGVNEVEYQKEVDEWAQWYDQAVCSASYGKGGKPKGKGKGKGDFAANNQNWGYQSNWGGLGKGGKGTPKGKASSVNFGKGKGKSNMQCWTCWGYGHTMTQCPNAKGKGKRNVNSMENEDNEYESENNHEAEYDMSDEGEKQRGDGWYRDDSEWVPWLSALEKKEQITEVTKDMNSNSTMGKNTHAGTALTNTMNKSEECGIQNYQGTWETVKPKRWRRKLQVNTLEKKEHGSSLNSVNRNTKWTWKKYEATLDSGSVENVGSKKSFKSCKIIENQASKDGLEYVAAGGHTLKNQGEKHVEFYDAYGQRKKLIVQMTEVKKILLSESKICDAGHWIWRNKSKGEIINEKTGEATPFKRKGGMYVMDMWIYEEVNVDENGKEIEDPSDLVAEVEKGRKEIEKQNEDSEDEEDNEEEFERTIRRLAANASFHRRGKK